MAKSLLLVSRQAPWTGLAAREVLDIALAGGAFDLPVGMLFLDDGVLQLQTQQQPEQVEQKDLCANLQALPLFGIEALYVCARSLQERGMRDSPLGLPAQVVDVSQIRDLFAHYDQVITF
jgi:tRNA 2-thiouridine synthesizing protein C